MTPYPKGKKIFRNEELTPDEAIEMLDELNDYWGLGVSKEDFRNDPNRTYEFQNGEKIVIHALYAHGNKCMLIVTLGYRSNRGFSYESHELALLSGSNLHSELERIHRVLSGTETLDGTRKFEGVKDIHFLLPTRFALRARLCVERLLLLRFHVKDFVEEEGKMFKMIVDGKKVEIVAADGCILSRDAMQELLAWSLYEDTRILKALLGYLRERLLAEGCRSRRRER